MPASVTAVPAVQPRPDRLKVSVLSPKIRTVLLLSDRRSTSKVFRETELPWPLKSMISISVMALSAIALKSRDMPEPSRRNVSVPLPPSMRVKSLVEIAKISSPAPPRRTSAPPAPSRISSPVPAMRTSLPAVPVRVSAPVVPT